MKFKNLEEYDKELKDFENLLTEMKEHIEKHPEELGTAGNYETLNYAYNLLKNDKAEFIKELNQIN